MKTIHANVVGCLSGNRKSSKTCCDTIFIVNKNSVFYFKENFTDRTL